MNGRVVEIDKRNGRERQPGRSLCEETNAKVVLRDLHKRFGANEVLRGVSLQV
jgi:hypothetical protein